MNRNHRNRSTMARQAEAPTQEEIRVLREAAKMSPTAAARLIQCSIGAWRKWESGERQMHPATWELFRIKTVSTEEAEKAFAAWWEEQIASDNTPGSVAKEAWLAAVAWLLDRAA